MGVIFGVSDLKKFGVSERGTFGDGLYQAFMMILGWLIIKTVHLMAVDVAGKKVVRKKKKHSKSSPRL